MVLGWVHLFISSIKSMPMSKVTHRTNMYDTIKLNEMERRL